MIIGFVFTNYNNSHFTRDAVKSIHLNNLSKDSIIVIVDNKSEAIEIESLKEIKQDYPDIHLILNNENLVILKD